MKLPLNALLAGGNICLQLMPLANSLNPDQDRRFWIPTLIVFLKELVNRKKSADDTTVYTSSELSEEFMY